MNYTLVVIPTERDLKFLNNLRNYIYQNDFRFKNKPLDSDTHITIANIEMDEDKIAELKETLQANIHKLKPFTIKKEEYILTKEDKEPNYKFDNPYTWIALKFPQRKDIYQELDRITKELGINNNEEYINNVRRIERDIEEKDYIANHINLSNYTRRDRANDCWNYFNDNLPKEILFNKIGLRDEKGKIIFIIKI